MALLREGTVGILPAGALGVAFFFHLTRGLHAAEGRVFLVAREGSMSGAALRAAARLHVVENGVLHDVAGAEWFGFANHDFPLNLVSDNYASTAWLGGFSQSAWIGGGAFALIMFLLYRWVERMGGSK